jgi:hypothetical protein
MDESKQVQRVPPLLEPEFAESPLAYWSRRLLACNPFYLISAACLLFGLYRLTIDPTFRRAELRQLATIFGSLQLYEILVVITAIILAWRRIWYDSTLLVTLENMLVLVPFILVTLAVFLGNRVAWIVCGTGACLAVLKFWSLKRLIRELNLPHRLLGIGLVILSANLAAPFYFRSVQKDNADLVAGYTRHAWLVVLPLMLGLVNLLRRPTEWGSVAARRSWLPLLMASIWITASAVHLYCIGYIYDLKWQLCLLAPVLWVASWTGVNRFRDFDSSQPAEWLNSLLVVPVLVAFLGAWDGASQIVLTLAGLNTAIFAGIYFQQRTNRVAYHMLLISVTTVLATMPVTMFSRGQCVTGAILGYIIFRAVLSRSPEFALAGAVATALATGGLLEHVAYATRYADQFAIQAGLAFALVHSLRWVDRDYTYAPGLRACIAITWFVHSIGWMHNGPAIAGWTVTLVAVFVLGCYFLTWLIWRHWASKVVPVAAVLILMVTPGKSIIHAAQAAPTGLLAILMAFIMFGLGTVIALKRNRWNPS